jgi:hypothetical protein
LGFWLRPRYSATPDGVFGAILAVILVAIAAAVMRILVGPWRRAKRDRHRTGYELTFHDFCRLVSEPYSQPVIAPLLSDWYGYEIAGQGPETLVRSEHGHVVDLRGVHNRIQIDPAKQYAIYQRAMDLWR